MKKTILILGRYYARAACMCKDDLLLTKARYFMIEDKIFASRHLREITNHITSDKFFILVSDLERGFVIGDQGYGYVEWTDPSEETSELVRKAINIETIDGWIAPVVAFLQDTDEIGMFEKVKVR